MLTLRTCITPVLLYHSYSRTQRWTQETPDVLIYVRMLMLIFVCFPFSFKIFFLMWAIFKVFTKFVTILLLFSVLVFWLPGM